MAGRSRCLLAIRMHELPCETFGGRLRRLRLARNLTISELAAKCGVSVPAISNWELDRARPKAYRIPKLAKTLAVPEQEIRGHLGAETFAQTVSRVRREVAELSGVPLEQVRIIVEI